MIVLAGVVVAGLEGGARLYAAWKSAPVERLLGPDDVATAVRADIVTLVREAHPYVMYRLAPNQRFRTLAINALGFRGPEITKEKPAGIVRVALLGGSTAWGYGATSDAETLAGRLERHLNGAASPRRWQVINAAVPGYVSTQGFIRFWDEIVDLRPDAVITFDGYNDAWAGFDNRTAGWPLQFDRLFRVRLEGHPLTGVTAWTGQWLLGHSAFLDLVAYKLRVWRNRRHAAEIAARYAEPGSVARVFGRNLGYLHALARDRGIATLFALQPIVAFGPKALSAEERGVLATWNATVPGYSDYIARVWPLLAAEGRRLAARRGLRFVDLSEVFRDVRDTMFLDESHLVAAGAERIAAALAAEVQRLPGLPIERRIAAATAS